MIWLLEKWFIKKTDDEAEIRQSYGVLCGAAGILLNLLLFAGKFLAGSLSNSIAIVADAFNNLSDAGSSVVSLLGFKMAGQKPDKEHPFGHGRMEYVSGFVIAAIILVMAYELIKDSILKIIYPEDTVLTYLVAVILVVSIFMKIYMFAFNRRIGKKIQSASMKATAMDSLSDACATAVVLICAVTGHFTGLQIDGYCGVLVGLFILYAGIAAAREMLNLLLGQKPDEQFVQNVRQIVLSHEPVCGVHDLIVHDYGPERRMISLHAEVPAEEDILVIHDVIDHIENDLRTELHCEATIHMDPVVTGNEHVDHLKKVVRSIVKQIDHRLSIHDFRIVEGPTHTNLIFDVVVPYKFRMDDEELIACIAKEVRSHIGEEYAVVIRIDKG